MNRISILFVCAVALTGCLGEGVTEVVDPERRLAAGDTDLLFADRGKVDLRGLVREQVHLNIPLKPVCGPDCAGLCPTCGANRNRIKCGCWVAEIDPRLAPLQALKQRMDVAEDETSNLRDTRPGNKHGEPET